MSVTLNAKATSFPSFTIGKGGATIYQGTSLPNNANGNAGDFYIYVNGATSEIFQKQGSSWTAISSGGDVTGPLVSTNNAIAIYSGTSGQVIKNTAVTIDSSNNIAGANNATLNGTLGATNATLSGTLTAGSTITISADTGLVKSSRYVLYNTTTNNTPTQLFLDGASEQLVLQNNTTVRFKMQLVGRRTDANGSNYVASFDGAISRDGSAATTAILGDIEQDVTAVPNTLDWSVSITADNTNGALDIQVTGDNSANIQWGAVIDTMEITN